MSHDGEDRYGWIIEHHVYQIGMYDIDEGWCCSNWIRPPPDALWQIREEMWMFMTYVTATNLNFSNTPLEHRYNLHIHNTDPELKILAQNERQLWRGSRETFIPFKRPHPKGYQGLWMSPSLKVRGFCQIMEVRDTFTFGHALEHGWYHSASTFQL